MTNTELLNKIKAEIERRREANKKQYLSSSGDMSWQRMCGEEDCLVELLSFIDSLPEEKPSEDLDKAVEKQINEVLFKWSYDDEDGIEQYVHDAFIAGSEWQKEQDQPITGNSLEQEWLRYVEKKKKECKGELPSLGEYGWLMIARHFANWQKKQMMKVSEEDALLLERVWLTLYNLGHEELAERLKTFKEKIC